MPQASTTSACKSDRRSLRSQRALKSALAAEILAGRTYRASASPRSPSARGLTRRTFYSHYKDIPDFIEQVEDGLLTEVRSRVRTIAEATLPELYQNIERLEPAPGSVELFELRRR